MSDKDVVDGEAPAACRENDAGLGSREQAFSGQDGKRQSKPPVLRLVRSTSSDKR
jgi:hypothetical protein